ncbi:hypothetical protein CDL15_Pgr028506 [Punica granatum]|uniref:Uncharacterized protein n=1 Tax=Punica granatum TaxID=22663 RepID=A0A218VWZ3_PUNGR|nr:hypothetical protein CDL15_Pgr028506 [Punica granatum]
MIKAERQFRNIGIALCTMVSNLQTEMHMATGSRCEEEAGKAAAIVYSLYEVCSLDSFIISLFAKFHASFSPCSYDWIVG